MLQNIFFLIKHKYNKWTFFSTFITDYLKTPSQFQIKAALFWKRKSCISSQILPNKNSTYSVPTMTPNHLNLKVSIWNKTETPLSKATSYTIENWLIS